MQSVVGVLVAEVYPILRLSHQRQSEPSPNVALCHTIADVDAFIEQYCKQREIETYRSQPRGWRSADSRPREQRREKIEKFFDGYATKRAAFGQMFLDNRSPPLWPQRGAVPDRSSRECKIVYNESLKELEIFRVIDTFTAYQELQCTLAPWLSLTSQSRKFPTRTWYPSRDSTSGVFASRPKSVG